MLTVVDETTARVLRDLDILFKVYLDHRIHGTDYHDRNSKCRRAEFSNIKHVCSIDEFICGRLYVDIIITLCICGR